MIVGIVLGRLLGISFQAENGQPYVLQNTGSDPQQVTTQAAVVLEPPKGGPRKDQVVGAGPTQPFEFANRRLVVRGRSPISAVSFQKRQDAPAGPCLLFAAPLIIVHQDEGAAGRNGLDDFLNREL